MINVTFLSILAVFLGLFVTSTVVFAAPAVPTLENNGLAALAQSQSDDHGLVQAAIRSVPLDSGSKAALSFTGDELIGFVVGEMATSGASVNPNGRVNSPGHRIAMMAASASSILDRMINMKGVAEARTASSQNGEIVLLSSAN